MTLNAYAVCHCAERLSSWMSLC